MKNNRLEEIELALKTTNVTVITPTVIAPIIADVARDEAIVSQLFTPMRDLVNKAGRQLIVPKYVDNIVVYSDVAEQATILASSFSYDALTVNVAKFGIRIDFQTEAIEQATRDIIKDGLYMAGKAYAKEADLRAETALLTLFPVTITTWSSGTVGTVGSSNVPIVNVISATGATVSTFDSMGGTVLLTGSISGATVVVSCSDVANTQEGTGTLILSDVFTLAGAMSNSSINPDVLLVSDNDLVGLVSDTAFQNLFVPSKLYQCCEKNKLFNGEVGCVLKYSVISSGIIPSGVAILADSSRIGYDVIKRDLEGYSEKLFDQDMVRYHLWAEREFKLLDTLAVGLIVNV